MPPIAGFIFADHLTWFISPSLRAPKLNENFKKSQFIKNEKKALIKKKSAKNVTRYWGSKIILFYFSPKILDNHDFGFRLFSVV